MLMSEAQSFAVPFETVSTDQLKQIEQTLVFSITSTGIVHGLAGWFDVVFEGQDRQVCLTTSPSAERTHWYQIRFLFQHPLAVNAGQQIECRIQMTANEKRSYNLQLDCSLINSACSTGPWFYRLDEQQYFFPTVPSHDTFIYPDQYQLYPSCHSLEPEPSFIDRPE